MSKEIFKPKYQWIRVSDICPAPDQKVLIVQDTGNGGTLIDRLIVETACYDAELHKFWNHNGNMCESVLFWSIFPYDLENKIYKTKGK